MPKPQSIPKKYKACIEEAIIELRLVAEKMVAMRATLRDKDYALHEIQSDLRDIELACLSTALDLSEIDVASDCNACPSAPPMIKYQAALEAIAKHLEQLADYSRQASQQ